LKKMADGINANQGSDTLSLSDTIHIFLNHWPSRSAGQMASENRRMWVAQTLRLQIDSLLMKYPTAKIVIAGDFNDEPHDISLTRGLGACAETSSNDTCHLVNLSAQYQGAGKRGTHKYQGEWSVLDQLIISNTLLHSMHGLHCNSADAHIFDEDFLLVDDENGLGKRPFRTYDGYRYAGGFSDHLAIYLDLWIRPSSGPSPH
jgi:predicted extracellular nuclease